MRHQVFERGWLSSNNILFFDDDGASLVDTGYCTHAAQTLALVEAALSNEKLTRKNPAYSLKRIINTHLHSDHCGGNAALLEKYPHAELHIPALEAGIVSEWDEERLSYRATGQQCPRFMYTHTIEPNQQLVLGGQEWRCLAAPGHDPHSLMLFNDVSKTLISADALWEDGCGVIFPELRGEPGFNEALATLDLIERLKPQQVIPGHGAPFSCVSEALSRARKRLYYLQEDAQRNAAHALRVLLKFKLLEAKQIKIKEVKNWLQRLEYFQVIHFRYYANLSQETLLKNILERLLSSNAARTDGEILTNL